MAAEHYKIPADFRRIPSRLNLAEEVLKRAKDLGDNTALVHAGGSRSYGELADGVARFARGLTESGIEAGDRILFRMHNSPEFAIGFLGTVAVGAIPVLQNSLATPDEIAYVLDSCHPVCALTFSELAQPLRDKSAQFQKGLIVARGARINEHSFEALASTNGSQLFVRTGSNEPAFMVYTSGTTGKPKGIVHAHRWIVALGDSNRLRLPPMGDDVVLASGEWSFIAALGQNLLFPLRNGVRVGILEGRATPERILEAIERYRVTLLFSVATIYRRLLALADLETRYDLSSLRGCNSTGEPLEEVTYLQWKQRVGCDIWEHYGISEMQMVFGQGPSLPVRPGSVGIPLPGTRVAILGDDYEPVEEGAVGNLLIGADDPGFFLGYHNNAELTEHVRRNGWYHTGDLARQDKDGYIWIAGRSDDCFKSRGIFISPVEIENALRAHPAVAEACVVAQPDSEIGNRIRAIVVAHDAGADSQILAEELKTFLGGKLARYKLPHSIEFMAELPKSPVGKVLRRSLRAPTIETSIIHDITKV